MNPSGIKLITLTTFDNSYQAHLCRSYLAEYHIEGYIFDENMVMINPLYNNLLGGVKITVSSTDFIKAREILKEFNGAPLTDEQDKTIVCPHCGSPEIDSDFKSASSFKSKLALALAFLTSTYPLHVESNYYCKNCKKSFERK